MPEVENWLHATRIFGKSLVIRFADGCQHRFLTVSVEVCCRRSAHCLARSAFWFKISLFSFVSSFTDSSAMSARAVTFSSSAYKWNVSSIGMPDISSTWITWSGNLLLEIDTTNWCSVNVTHRSLNENQGQVDRVTNSWWYICTKETH